MLNYSALTFIELVVVFILVVLVQGAILQVSCALFNLLAGASGTTLPQPVGREAAVESGRDLTPTAESITTSPGADHPNFEQAIRTPEDAGGDDERIVMSPGVPRLGLERAMRIIFVVALVNIGTSFIVFRVLRLAGLAAGASALRTLPLYLLSAPLHILVLSCMSALMLPTRFGKGVLVALIFVFLSLVLGVILFGCVVIAMAFGLRIPSFL